MPPIQSKDRGIMNYANSIITAHALGREGKKATRFKAATTLPEPGGKNML